jgi:hypothetical protein
MPTGTSSPLSVRWYDPSKVLVPVYQQTKHNIPEDFNQQQHYENLQSHHQLMLYRKIIIVCSESHKNKIHTLGGQNVELFNVNFGGTNSNYWALKGYGNTKPEMR